MATTRGTTTAASFRTPKKMRRRSAPPRPPSLGLAPLIRLDIARLLREIADSKNVAVLLAEQDITLAQRCADQAYVLRRGRIVAEMAGGELIDRERLRQLYLGSAPAAS